MCNKSMGFFSSCFIQSQLKRNIVMHSIDACVTTYQVRSQCKYTAEYWFKIAKQTTLNRATSAATHFQGKYTSIQIREPATTEAVIGGILWKKLFLKFSQYSQENTCVRASF